MPEQTDPADALFKVPPAQFVAARNELASALRKSGQKSQADAIKALAKPPVSVWAINQIAREDSDLLARFLAASDELRAAQMAGTSTAEARQATQAAQAQQRAALQPLLARAEQHLEAAGMAAAKGVLDKVANDLRFGAVDDSLRARLVQGRLQTDVAPTDFGALIGLAGDTGAPQALARVIPIGVSHAARPAPAAKPAVRPDDLEHKRLRAEADGLRAKLRETRSEVTRTQKTLPQRRLAHERAQAHLVEQRRALEQAESTAAAASEALAAVEGRLAEQEHEIARLSAKLEDLEARLG
jgi:DNA repair exonuclease SbcCD ATPase subunit